LWPAAGGGVGGDDRRRFVVEELRRIGAVVHLAEPAETAALRGNKKRAKNDRADARHLRLL
jgi:transposase